MADKHVSISNGASNTQVVFHNPGVQADAVGAGQTLAPTTKAAGQPNASAIGQVPNTTVIFRNPA